MFFTKETGNCERNVGPAEKNNITAVKGNVQWKPKLEFGTQNTNKTIYKFGEKNMSDDEIFSPQKNQQI